MRTNQLLLTLSILLAAGLPSCGETEPIELNKRAEIAVAKGEWETALTDFDTALAQMDRTNPEYMRAAVGRCRALARLKPIEGKDAFLKLAAEEKDKIELIDFHIVVSELVIKHEFLLAAELMEAGQKLFPESAKLKELGEDVASAASKAGDTQAQSKLNSLGYVGSSK